MEIESTPPQFALRFMEHQLGDPLDANVDVYVTLPNGANYVATFYTLANIQRLMARHRETGESANGSYFWGTGMIIVERLGEADFRAAVEDLLDSGLLEKAFEGPFRDDAGE